MITSIPNHANLQDQQFIQVLGPDGITTGFSYDAQQRALYFKESQIIFPSFHGATHIAEDPVPGATCDTPGLMSADDKCKLDAILQTRIGVLGFSGAGFAEDGGWMCFPPDAQVTLANGSIATIASLNVGDLVITHTGSIYPVLEKFERQYTGKMRKIWVSGHYKSRFVMTPEHPILAITNRNHVSAIGAAYGKGDFSDPSWIEAKNLRSGDYIARRHCSNIINDRRSINLNDYALRVEVENGLAYSSQASGLSYSKGNFRNTAIAINNEIEISPEFMRLCGYYLAEGHIDGPLGRPKTVVFSVSLSEAFGELGADITHCCETVFGIRPTSGPDPKGGQGGRLKLQSAIAARFVQKLLPGTAHTKIIPQWMMELPIDKQKWLLLAFLEGDAGLHIRKKSKSIDCGICNQQLLNQICGLLERHGCNPIVREHDSKLNGKIHHSYKVTIQAADAPWLWEQLGGPELQQSKFSAKRLDFSIHNAGFTFRRIKEITEIDYSGNVYNLAVNHDNSYVVNGCIVHNCGDIILAAGTDFISLERIGNVIRFSVDSPIPMNCACFQAGARVLMHNGTTKAIEDIVTGDLVVTHRGRLRKVKQLFTTLHDGTMYRWKADKHSGENVIITGNHPVMALKRSAAYVPSGRARKIIKELPSWIEAAEIEAGDLIARRRSHHIVTEVRIIDVLSELGDGFVERDGLVYSIRPDGFIDGQANGLPRFIEVNNDFLDLLGYYAAEGCASRKNGVRFSVHTEEMSFGDIGAETHRILSTLFGLEPAIHGRATPNGRDIQVMCVPLVELFSRWFGKKKQKHFPEWVMRLPYSQQARIVAAVIKGDGYISRHLRGAIYFTLGMSQRSMIDQILFMSERCGWEPAHQSPILERNRIRYRMSITDSNAPDLCRLLNVPTKPKKLKRDKISGEYTLHRLAEWTAIHYQGVVYNFEVEEDNSYIVDGIVVHNCEECSQIFWVQDETDVASIRPPSCNGKLPGINTYGELKVFLFPESTIVDPNSPAATLNNKGSYPALIFKRYENAIVPGSAELELILKRDANNKTVTEIGWAMTPGAAGIVECVWFTGKDNDGNQMRFDLTAEPEPGLLGALLYKGHLISKKMGVITGYTSTILATNQYTIREWDTDGKKPLGDPFTATNVWQYANPENPPSGRNPKTLLLDSSVDLLPIGTLVDLWFFKVGEVAGEPIRRYYFSKKPHLNPNHLWSWVGQIQFGDIDVARAELQSGPGSDDKIAAVEVSDIRNIERQLWGLTGYDDPLISYDIAMTAGTEIADLSSQHRAIIDTDLPGLKVVASSSAIDDFSERPVWLWNRRNMCNTLLKADIGRPASSMFSPYDIAIRASVDENTESFMRVVGKGQTNGLYYVRVAGVHFHDLPPFGTVRVISPENNDVIFRYNRKFMFSSLVTPNEEIGSAGTVPIEPTGGFVPDFTSDAVDTITLTGGSSDNLPYPGDVGDILELLHQEYTGPLVRVEFSYDPNTGLVEVQFKVGTLDMSLPYEEDVIADDADDFVRGLAPGYAVSAVYSQAAPFTGVGTQPDASPEGFIVYEGGAQIGGTLSEYWNTIEVMVRDNQVWIWWNRLLIPPSNTLSQALATPVTVTTPYFTITQDSNRQFGKAGLRLWPGAKVRRFDVRTQMSLFSEFQYGQLEVV